MAIHIHLPARAKDVSNRFVTKVDIRLPNESDLGTYSGKIMNRGTIVYKEGSGYRPWFHKGNVRLSLKPGDLVSADLDAGFSNAKHNPREVTRLRDAHDSRIDDFRQFCKINKLRIDDPKSLEKFAKMNHLTPEEIKKVGWVTLNPYNKDAYRGSFNVEVDKSEYARYKVGQEVNYKGSKVKVEKKTLTEGKKNQSGEMIPEKYLVGFQTIDADNQFVTYKGDKYEVVRASKMPTGKPSYILKSRTSGGSNFEVLQSETKAASKDARERRFDLPVYTKAEVEKKLRDGEWEAETDVVSNKRVEMRKGSKRFQIYVKDASASEYRTKAEAASREAANKTKEATKYGSPYNHAQASQSQYAAGMAWTNVAKSPDATPEEKEAANKKSEEHRRQSDFHYKNSIA